MCHQAPGWPSYWVSMCGAMSRYFCGKRSCHKFNGSLTWESESSKIISAIGCSSKYYERELFVSQVIIGFTAGVFAQHHRHKLATAHQPWVKIAESSKPCQS